MGIDIIYIYNLEIKVTLMDMKRSFTKFINILSDRGHKLTIELLEQYLIINVFNNNKNVKYLFVIN